MHVLYTLSCSIPHTLVTGFKSGEFGGNSRGRMNSGVSLLANTAFFNDVTIQAGANFSSVVVLSKKVLTKEF